MNFPSEDVFLKLLDQLQPPARRRDEMLRLFAEAKGTAPPDINARLREKPQLWNIVRQLIEADPTEEQMAQISLEVQRLSKKVEVTYE